MKKRVLLWLCVALSGQALVAQEMPGIEAKIEKVTVFFQGAQVLRTTKLNLQSGKHTYIIKNLSPEVMAKTIQIAGEGDYTLLAVNYRDNYLETNDSEKFTEQMKGKLDSLTDKIEVEDINLNVLASKEELLKRLQETIPDGSKALTSAEISESLAFRQKELTQIRLQKAETDKKRRKLREEYDKIYQQITSLRNAKKTHTGEVWLTISAPRNMQIPLQLTYFVQKANWTPFYDFRVKNIISPLDVAYKAYVTQATGEDWKEVQLVLSSGDPNQHHIAPSLKKWYLGRQVVVDYDGVPDLFDRDPETPEGTSVSVSGFALDSDDSEEAMADKLRQATKSLERKEEAKKREVQIPVTKSDAPTVFNYEINAPYTILADGQTQVVEIKTTEIPADYHYYAVPKLEKTAYLIASLRDWEKYDLLEGEVNLFLEGTFLGASRLNLKEVGDTLNVSLGQDKRILVNYNQLRQFNKRKILSGNQVASRAYEITIRNTQPQPIRIVVEDQLPISTAKEIEVIQEDISGAKVNMDNKVKWEFTLPSKEEKKMTLKYSVKYPTSWQLNTDF